VTRIARDPLLGVTRLLVDGTNLLHQLSRGPERQPPAALIGRLRAAVPPEVRIELVFDGPPERGLRGERIAAGLAVRFSGRYSADTILVTLAEEAGEDAGSILVVTDDRGLAGAVRRRGARTVGAPWLLGRLSRPRLAAPSVGNRRPPAIAQPTPNAVEEPAAEPWSPGRGATRKIGNPKRRPKSRGV
jgi:hypothetical protein